MDKNSEEQRRDPEVLGVGEACSVINFREKKVCRFFVDCITVPSSYAVLMFLLHFLTSLRGSAWANTLSQNMQTILLFLYVWWKKIHHETWGGRAHLLGGLARDLL